MPPGDARVLCVELSDGAPRWITIPGNESVRRDSQAIVKRATSSSRTVIRRDHDLEDSTTARQSDGPGTRDRLRAPLARQNTPKRSVTAPPVEIVPNHLPLAGRPTRTGCRRTCVSG